MVLSDNSVCLAVWGSGHEPRALINDVPIHPHLHGAKEVMIKVGNMHSLVKHQEVPGSRLGVVKANDPTDCLIGLLSKGRVVPLHGDRLFMVKYD